MAVLTRLGKSDLDDLLIALQSAEKAGGFLDEAKLFATSIKELEIEISVDDKGQSRYRDRGSPHPLLHASRPPSSALQTRDAVVRTPAPTLAASR